MSARPYRRAGEASRDCGAFYLDLVGQFGPREVHVRWSDSRRPSNEQVDRTIEATWLEETRRAAADGRTLFNGRLCRLIQCDADERTLTLTLGEVSFREFVGTNVRHANVRYVHGSEVLADPLGVSAAVIAGDGFLLLGRRSRTVFANTGLLHPIGGIVEPGRQTGAVPDPFRTIAGELKDELGLPGESISQSLCLGLVRDKRTVQPEMIFDVYVSAEVEAIRAAAAQADDAGENEQLLPVRDHPAAMVAFLEQHCGELTPVALATLLLHGQRHWGTGWFTTVRGYLRNVI